MDFSARVATKDATRTWRRRSCTPPRFSSTLPFAVGRRIREYRRLVKVHGRGRWRKRKGTARVRLADGTVRRAELHWYEATGVGAKNSRSSDTWIDLWLLQDDGLRCAFATTATRRPSNAERSTNCWLMQMPPDTAKSASSMNRARTTCIPRITLRRSTCRRHFVRPCSPPSNRPSHQTAADAIMRGRW